MVIFVWNDFSKKRNSTKRPATGGTRIECVLKEPTSLHEPTFKLLRSSLPSQEVDPSYIAWGAHYYFVTDVVYFNNDIVEISCKLDCLASYKGSILNSTQLIERAELEYNENIPDNLNCPTLEIVTKNTSYPLTNLHLSRTGCYVLGTVAGGQQAVADVGVGVARYYAVDTSNMRTFGENLCSNQVLQALQNEFTNPMEAIISCIWLPISLSDIPGTMAEIYCGTTAMGAQGKIIANRYMTHRFLIDRSQIFPSTPPLYDFSAENYLQAAPYSTAILYLPFVGNVKFPLEITYRTSYEIEAIIDVVTGDIVYNFEVPLESYAGNCAMQCAISSIQTNYRAAFQAVIEFIGMTASNLLQGTYNPYSAIGSFVGNTVPRAVNSALSASEIHSQHGGAISSGLSAFLTEGFNVIVRVFTRMPAMGVNDMLSLYGRPLQKVASLSEFTGYVQCSGAVLDIVAEYEERKEIEYFLDTGFYIE